MSISVRVYAELRHYLPADWQDGPMDLPPGARVGDLLALLGIPQEEIGLVSLDGRIAQEDQSLDDASEARIFPPVGGGQFPERGGSQGHLAVRVAEGMTAPRFLYPVQRHFRRPNARQDICRNQLN